MSELVIEMQAVRKAFGRNEVLRGVSFNVEQGRTFAFLGRNAAGKTTAIRMMLGLLHRDDGSIRVLGMDPSREHLRLRGRVGYLAEDQTMYGWMRVEEILRFVAPFYATWDHQLALRYTRDFELPLPARIKHLSKGQNVRLGLVQIALIVSGITLGFLVATIVGIGVFLSDLGAKMDAFWRSRPIDPDLWFWTKFATGLAVIIAMLHLPLFFVSIPILPDGPSKGLLLWLGSHLLAFTIAVAMACLLRHAVYASIMSIGILLSSLALVYGEIRSIEYQMLLLLAFALLATLVAWLAVRYDIGYKG